LFLFVIREIHCIVVHCRNVIPTTVCGSASSVAELLDSSCPVSAGAALAPLMSSVPGSDADAAHCISSVKSMTTDTVSLTLSSGESISSADLHECTVRLSRSATVGIENAHEDKRGCKQVTPKTRIRRTQLKMLADNLSKFYAPSAGGKRRELMAQKRSAVDVERTARERQLEVIRKQVSLVAKRKKAELEMATAASHGDISEPASKSFRTIDGMDADIVSKRKYATYRFRARLTRKLRKKHSKLAVQRKQKLTRSVTKHHKAAVPTGSESTFF